MGYLVLARARRKRELANDLVIGSLAASGDAKAINSRLKELQRER